MRRTLQEQIAANKRASLIYAFFLIVLLAALGTVLVGVYEPRAWYLGTAGATLLGVIGAVVATKAGSNIVLAMSHAREANAPEDQVLRNVTEEMAIAAGLPMPKVMVIDDDSPNAFATGPDPEHAVVAVTTGLMRKLDRDELQGVIAHEMSHVRNYDIRFMTVIAIIAGFIPMLADVFLRSTFWGGPRRKSNRDDNQLQAIFMVVGLVLAILAPIFAVLLEMAVSRKREFLADASAAELTRYPEGLANALRKIASDPDPLEVANRATQHMYIVNPLRLNGLGSSLLSTHPPTEERISALMGLAGNKLQGLENLEPPVNLRNRS
jgi:heat shock protein HtpX